MRKRYQNMTLDELCRMIDLISPTSDNYPYIVDFRTDFYYIAPQAMERFCIPEECFSQSYGISQRICLWTRL